MIFSKMPIFCLSAIMVINWKIKIFQKKNVLVMFRKEKSISCWYINDALSVQKVPKKNVIRFKFIKCVYII